MNQATSNQQYDAVIARCKEEFVTKNKKYKGSLSAYDVLGVGEKTLIKIVRVRTIQEKGESKVEGETIENEFPAIVNYAVYGIILASQLKTGFKFEFEGDVLFSEYDKATAQAKELFQKKNHDYGEAWRDITISFMAKEIHSKLKRLIAIYSEAKLTKKPLAEAQTDFLEIFCDVLNYAVFCTIRIDEGTNAMI